MPGTESFEFQAETTQLLDLVVNSLYTNKDIFLRELISNASDALDRLRFEALTSPDLVPDNHEYAIRLDHDPSARTLTIHDSGIGMSRDELIENVGTIAKSGTRELLKRASEGAGGDLVNKLIGQFGVGFYSAFMVADQVSLLTRRAGDERATLWESSGTGRYDLTDAKRDGCGTSVTLHLKAVDPEAGIADYSDPEILELIVKRYSNFITYPIRCEVTRTEYERNEDGTVKRDSEPHDVTEEKTLNAMQPIWTRPPAEVSEHEYAEFYRHVSHDWTEPLRTIPLRAEGRLEYRALLFIPAQAPLDLALGPAPWGLQLYAKQVMIMERCEDLLDPYLRFVKGVVDSSDLPLNVSREMLQQDRHILQIRRWLTGRVLKTLTDLQREDGEKYHVFWKNFGRVLKEGMATDTEHRERLQELLLFSSSADPEKLTTLEEYCARMPSEQTEVFYISGESRHILEGSPHLEALVDRGYEVIFLTDPVDELVVQRLREYDGKKLRSAADAELDLGDEGERDRVRRELEEKRQSLGGLLGAVAEALSDRVKEVKLSARLQSSPACLVSSEHELSPHLERMLRASQVEVPKQLRILELNPDHPIVVRMNERFEADAGDPLVADAAELLLAYALLAEGSEIPDPGALNERLADLLLRSL